MTGKSEPEAYPAAAVMDPWARRSARMACWEWTWFVPKAATDPVNTRLGRCRRHAPTMIGFPVVYLTDWCGDHKLDENKA
jgi:hypothetical protein